VSRRSQACIVVASSPATLPTMRWMVVALIGLGLAAAAAGWKVWQHHQVAVLNVDFGDVIANPEAADAAPWPRGPHPAPAGTRLRAESDAVILAEGLRWELRPGAEIIHDAPDAWRLVGGTAALTTTSALGLRVTTTAEVLSIRPGTRATFQVGPEATAVEVERGQITVGSPPVSTGADQHVLIRADRIAHRAVDPSGEGVALDVEADAVSPPMQGWYHGVVVPVVAHPGRTRGLAAVLDPSVSLGPAGDDVVNPEASVSAGPHWYLTLRRDDVGFRAARRAVAQVWTAAGITGVIVIWTAENGALLSRDEVAAPHAGWWELRSVLDRTAVAVGERIGTWSVTVSAPSEDPAPLVLGELVLTP